MVESAQNGQTLLSGLHGASLKKKTETFRKETSLQTTATLSPQHAWTFFFCIQTYEAVRVRFVRK